MSRTGELKTPSVYTSSQTVMSIIILQTFFQFQVDEFIKALVMPGLKFLLLFFLLQSFKVNALVEDVIDVLYLGREVIKTISSTWELADQVGVTSDIDLPFMQRKEKKIFSRMAELTQEFRNAEMMVINDALDSLRLALNCAYLVKGSRVIRSDNARTRILHPQ